MTAPHDGQGERARNHLARWVVRTLLGLSGGVAMSLAGAALASSASADDGDVPLLGTAGRVVTEVAAPAQRVLDPVAAATAAPAVDAVAEPLSQVVATVVDHAVAPAAVPVTEGVVQRVTERVLAPVVEEVTAPVTSSLTPAIHSVSGSKLGVVQPVVGAIQPIVGAPEPVIDTAGPVVGPDVSAVVVPEENERNGTTAPAAAPGETPPGETLAPGPDGTAAPAEAAVREAGAPSVATHTLRGSGSSDGATSALTPSPASGARAISPDPAASVPSGAAPGAGSAIGVGGTGHDLCSVLGAPSLPVLVTLHSADFSHTRPQDVVLDVAVAPD